MVNWLISFEVSGKYLSDAQAAVHKLRGVKNMGSKPIFEKAASPAAGPKTTDRSRIMAYLSTKHSADAKQVFDELTKLGVKTTLDRARAALNNMVTNGLARRVRPGLFGLTKKGKEALRG